MPSSVVGNTANIYGSYMYPSSDDPRYLAGGISTAVVALVVAILAVIIRLALMKQNKKLEERELLELSGQNASSGAEDRDERALGFRYIL